ncbi:MAG: shikimate dehydrogenase [Spirochaetes bacterium]|nr:MAG: shikimate dehydrogenase [Spirochaetota bacterium]
MPGALTRLYCIFGNPVRHSLSPRMHNAAFSALGMDAVYLAFEPSSIKDALAAMRALPIHGASVTIPYKTPVLPLLDSVDELAARIGSVNTVVNRNGSLHGANTDGRGALTALERAGFSARDKSVLVVGNGGSARAVAFTLLAAGARVLVAGRNESRIAALSAELAASYPGVAHRTLNSLDRALMKDIDAIVNTTPVGMGSDTHDTPIDASLLASAHLVMDIVYAPPMTRLLREARDAGCTIVQGTDMLLYQGVLQFELWTGMSAPVEIMRATIIDAMPHAVPE